MKAVNLGCGRRFHPDWENVDLSPAAPTVRAHDLRKGIPYPDGVFDIVYHSHVLEHFPRQAALGFVRECHRVLKVGGVMRVAVPDLEQIARLYLEALEKASQGVPGWRDNYEWMVLEMFDQAVRETSGGSCLEYLSQKPIPNWGFVYRRFGAEAEAGVGAAQSESASRTNGHGRLRFRNLGKIALKRIAKAVLSEESYETLRVGWFRRRGEVHQWMYDAYSLRQLLERGGFCNCQRRGATESQIPNWTEYGLDCDQEGTPHKPDSLFMEAVKP